MSFLFLLLCTVFDLVLVVGMAFLYERAVCAHRGRSFQIKPWRVVALVCFAASLFVIAFLTGGQGLPMTQFVPRVEWRPFANLPRGWLQYALNVVLFLPVGFFLRLLYSRYRHFLRVAVYGLCFSLYIEIVQMFGFGLSDVNDLLMNTLGAVFGAMLGALAVKIFPSLKSCSDSHAEPFSPFEAEWALVLTWLVNLCVMPQILQGMIGVGLL
ncbi:MAG: VanZ family protein [Peptococcaceae bacterium]|nr:VanZ family protein [Peptococcaceae bacterium]